MKSILSVFSLSMISGFLFLRCSDNSFDIKYEPVVTFSAVIGDKPMEFPGNSEYRNECSMKGDTIRMFFFTKDYKLGEFPEGSHIHMYIYPFDSDSVQRDSDSVMILGLENIYFRLQRYTLPEKTYAAGIKDTNLTDIGASMKAVRIGFRRGTEIRIKEFTAGLHYEGGTNRALEVKEGSITGEIQ